MDLNQLYFDYQILRMQADHAHSPERKMLNDRGAALVAGRIGCVQRAIGADAAHGWSDIAAASADRTGRPLPLPFGPGRGPLPVRAPANGNDA